MRKNPELALKSFGVSREILREIVVSRFKNKDIPVLLAGSVAEGISSEESDIDLLVISDEIKATDRSMIDSGAVVDTFGLQNLGGGGRIQISYISQPRIIKLKEKIEGYLSPNTGQLIYLDPADEQFLHRLVTGIPINNPKVVNHWSSFMGKEMASEYFFGTNTESALSRLNDLPGEIKQGEWESCAWMLSRIASILAIASMNYYAGETNQNEKWILRLLNIHAEKLGQANIDKLVESMLFSKDSANDEKTIIDRYRWLNEFANNLTALRPTLFTDRGHTEDKLTG